MTTVAIASMFKDSQSFYGRRLGQVDRFFAQLAAQQGRGDVFDLTFHLAVGKSADDTRDAVDRELEAWPGTRDGDYAKVYEDEGPGAPVASLESEVRFRSLSAAANVPFRSARDSGADYVLWVESDLILGEQLITSLLGGFAANPGFTMISPLTVFGQNGRDALYDTWGYRGPGGKRWGNEALPWFRSQPQRYLPMESVGCAAIIDGDFLHAIKGDFGSGCFPVLCSAVREAGGIIVCDTRTEIRHPSAELVASRLI